MTCGNRVDLSSKYGLQTFGVVSVMSCCVDGHLKRMVIMEYHVKSLTAIRTFLNNVKLGTYLVNTLKNHLK